MYLTSLNRVFIEKLIVAELVNKFLRVHKGLPLDLSLEGMNSVRTLIHYFPKNKLNVIHELVFHLVPSLQIFRLNFVIQFSLSCVLQDLSISVYLM
jgi:hypothetical protein